MAKTKSKFPYKKYKGTKTFGRNAIARFRGRSSIVRQLSTNGIWYFKRTVNAYQETGLSVDGSNLSKDSSNNSICLNYDPTTTKAAGALTLGTFGYFFSIQNLPSVSEFTTLFDSYKITKVVVKIIPYASNAQTAPSGAGQLYPNASPILHLVTDYDDVTQPAASESGIQDLQQYASYKRYRLNDTSRGPIKIILKPKVAAPVYQSSAFTAYSTPDKNPWLDCANSAIEHYGIRGIVEGICPLANTNYKYPMRIETTYYMKFRGER